MAIRIKEGKYKCSYCGKEYSSPPLADSCRDNHDLVYIQMSRQDLNRLLLYIQTGEQNLLTNTIISSLRKYVKRVEEYDFLPEM